MERPPAESQQGMKAVTQRDPYSRAQRDPVNEQEGRCSPNSPETPAGPAVTSVQPRTDPEPEELSAESRDS